MSEKGFWVAFAAGAAIGAGCALLYAPQTGAATRKKLRRGMDDAGDYLEDAGDYLKDQAEKLSKEAQKAIKLTQEYADSAVDSAAGLAAGASKTLKQAKSLL